MSADHLLNEQNRLVPDKMYLDKKTKKIQKKHARYNLSFADFGQKEDLERGLQSIIPFNQVLLLKYLRKNLPFGSRLPCAANFYFDISKCGVSFHGDLRSKNVIGVRLGAEAPLHF